MNAPPPPRVLAIYRHYWPDTTPYALILNAILERLATAGAEVAVYAGQPSYNDNNLPPQPNDEMVDGVRVRRISALPERKHWRAVRALNAAWFLLRAVAHAVLVRRYDVVIANSHPPVMIGVALRAIRLLTGARYVLHLQDLHPEASQAIRVASPGIGYRAALAIETANCRHAERLVTLSTDMVATLAQRGLPTDQIRVINNCPLPSKPDAAELPPCVTDASATRFLFAGNLGRFQNLETLVQAAQRLADRDDWRLIFMGAGALAGELEQQAGPLLDDKIFFVGPQPVSTAVAAMQACDYGIVSLAPQVSRYAYPSKASTYLSAGCPVLAVVEAESELGRTIADIQLGVVAAGFSAGAIADAMSRAIAERPTWTPTQRRRIAEHTEAKLGIPTMLTKWDAIWSELGVLAVEPSHAEPRRHAA